MLSAREGCAGGPRWEIKRGQRPLSVKTGTEMITVQKVSDPVFRACSVVQQQKALGGARFQARRKKAEKGEKGDGGN